jgi:hypothetical protein
MNKNPGGRNKQATDNLRLARLIWPTQLNRLQAANLRALTLGWRFSVASGDLQYLNGSWYVTHAGLLRLANRKHCVGIRVQPVREFCDMTAERWAFKATVYKSPTCKGFVGYGDADPSNVSPVVRGAEMRMAETRAVNRALRKAYGIGLCSVEEVGSFPAPPKPTSKIAKAPTLPAPVSGNGDGQPRLLRDRLCQLIRQHNLDPNQVKLYAADFCGTETLRDASRELIEDFINKLAERAAKDRDGLLCQLNSYGPPREVVS